MSGSRRQRLADEASAGKPRKIVHIDLGFVFVDELLKLQQLKRYSESDIKKVVDENDKKRAYNHSIKQTLVMVMRMVDDLELDPITDHSDAPVVVHGTYSECWELIKSQGLSRMSRNHIHFATGEPGEEGVISGMRSSCQILVFINLKKALSDGFRFYLSANNVILCPGNEQGFLPPQYFEKVVQTKPKRQLLLSAN
ncbi:tRNA 2'-phosphotransferase 1 [Stylophora pistillata]|uniref:tRNA 2'-phosphotransferase 1 n=1 Tax=Stylophora pistillata TaxID=50429 RepID=A0A2B4T0G5_STYPI|nr:tRNA 2'-phosphotransferase 1 [Stylophora pistillata]